MKVLNVGGNSKTIALPSEYQGCEHLLLDIDPKGKPDVLCDARELSTLSPAQFDVIYCSHNLEHYFKHDVPKVMAGFLHVLKPGGMAHIRVPDMMEVMRRTLERNLDIDDVLYTSPAGPIMVSDVMYGFSKQMKASGNDFYAHKTGFSKKSLVLALRTAGFNFIFSGTGNLEVVAFAFKGQPDPSLLRRFNLKLQPEKAHDIAN